MIPAPYQHQSHMADFWVTHPRVFNTSDPGTGKTRGALEGYVRCPERRRLLVVAPLSILQSSWENDCKAFFPQLSCTIAHGSPKKREKALFGDADVVALNHDGIKWLMSQDRLWQHAVEAFSHCVVDESTAFKNRTSQRSRAMLSFANRVEYLQLMTGTPNSNTVCDLWHQAFMLDGGERLGNQFFAFRSQVCTPVHVYGSPQPRWDDKPGSELLVADALRDITIRYRFDDCLDIPENHITRVTLDMPSWVRTKYDELRRDGVLEGTAVDAIHAGILVKKVLQLLSGAVYDSDGGVVRIHNARYELIMELMREREHCVVAYNWKHELRALQDACEKEGWKVGVINGDVPANQRSQIVEDFQAGKLKALFAHPQSASHGLTLTKGTTTLWASPTYNAEHFTQFNHRIYRAGQTRKTETVCIAYTDSKEVEVYERLQGKLGRMEDLLASFYSLSQEVA